MPKILIMYGCLLVTERLRKHFTWPLIHFSAADCFGSIFGSLGIAINKTLIKECNAPW